MNTTRAIRAAVVFAVLESLVAPVRAAEGGAAAPEKGKVWRVPTKCGQNCIYIVLKMMGKPVRYEEVERRMPDTDRGNSLIDLRDCARSFGLRAKISRGTPEALLRVPLPLVAHWEEEAGATGHYVVVIAATPEGVQYIDGTSTSIASKTLPEFQKLWSGYVLAVDERPWWYPLLPVVTALSVLLVGLSVWGRRGRTRPTAAVVAMPPEKLQEVPA